MLLLFTLSVYYIYILSSFNITNVLEDCLLLNEPELNSIVNEAPKTVFKACSLSAGGKTSGEVVKAFDSNLHKGFN